MHGPRLFGPGAEQLTNTERAKRMPEEGELLIGLIVGTLAGRGLVPLGDDQFRDIKVGLDGRRIVPQEEEIPVGEILVLVGFLFEEIRESAPRGEIIPLEAMDEQGQFPIGLIGAPEESPGFVIARKECSHG